MLPGVGAARGRELEEWSVVYTNMVLYTRLVSTHSEHGRGPWVWSALIYFPMAKLFIDLYRLPSRPKYYTGHARLTCINVKLQSPIKTKSLFLRGRCALWHVYVIIT